VDYANATMSAKRPELELNARDREVLRDVVRTFILEGEPVSSRTVAGHTRHGVSAATIRNVMADLEDRGLLEQPHSSAGRVPSRAGYHLYIDSLMESRELSAEERSRIDGGLSALSGDALPPEKIVGLASQLLSHLSGQIGILVTPAIGDTVMRSIEFVPLSGRRLLCVVVSEAGFVENKLVEADEDLSREELVRISNYLTENCRGRTLRSIRERLLAAMVEERAEVDLLLARAISLAQQGLEESSHQGVLVEGTTQLLSRPELGDVARVRRLLDTFADRQRLVVLLNQCLEGGGVRVVIGDDSAVTSDLGFSLVARSYGSREGARGTLGIFGPTRMEYERMIPLVDYLGESLSRALEASVNRFGSGE
jgi:heat-inducible transcriptional repressor